MHFLIHQTLQRAVHNFQNGNYDEAEALLSQLLKSHPRNFDALHILGVIKGIKNLHREALDFFKK
jgi:predicted Zn-dependent protease